MRLSSSHSEYHSAIAEYHCEAIELAAGEYNCGLPMIRAMFLEFPDDEQAWELRDQYMFGTEYLVAPITEYGARERSVYLPKGKWEAMDGSGVINSNGETVNAAAPLDYMLVYRYLGA
ncbi:MAG: hypothetical protein IKB34_07455 [Clostridia bacterium]|nr:hypothetical protein [Clostridia bacterium]